MIFNSVDEIKNYILSHSSSAINQAKEQIYQVINSFVKEYYTEYSPTMYERTYQLYKSLVKTDVISTGDGWEATIYFDLDKLDYYMKKINGREYPNKGWSETKTLDAAAHGSHGGYESGTAIWDDAIKVLNKEGYNILKNALIQNGIPISK